MLSNESFLQSVLSSGWYSPGLKIICACSGGIDSTVLLHLLSGLPNIQLDIIHFNHELRGSDSVTDMEHVKSLGRQYKYPVHVFTEDIQEYADNNKLSVEEAGSQRRRAVFLEHLHRSHFDLIATGQHQDDQIETILLNLYLGTGIQGLSGISDKRGSFVRPLLNHSRAEIENYARDYELSYRLDKSNVDVNYLRNNIRARLVPFLGLSKESTERDFFHDISKQGSTLYKKLNHSLDSIDNTEVTLVKEQKISLGLSRLSNYFSPIQKVIFDRAFQSISLMSQGLSSKHFKALKSLLPSEAVGREIQLPASFAAYRDRQQITIVRNSGYKWIKTLLGATKGQVFPFFTIEPKTMKVADHLKDPHYFWYLDDLNKYQVRRHQDGDKIQINNSGKSSTINQVLQEARVAPHLKKSFPVVVYKEEIVWVPGVRTSISAMLDISKSQENESKHCFVAQFQEGTFE